MGGCCSKEDACGGYTYKEEEEEFFEVKEEEDGARAGRGGARVRLKGSSRFASMFTQQGWKGVNQDAMTIWEDFGGGQDDIFCGVFDGHGPLGHKVACHVRDALTSKLSVGLNISPRSDDQVDHSDSSSANNVDDNDANPSHDASSDWHQWFSSRKATFVKAFEELDKELSRQFSIDCCCSGSTAVSLVKQREHLIIANLGDSRAVLCTRDDRDQRVPVQLTVDQKPNLPSEAERIRSCRGRVFALEEEPEVHRLWLPDEDSPGLAMARAFGDFCLKDFGLIATPLVSYRKLTEKDEFVVLATDGVWDVLSNKEVIKIVSSTAKRSNAAKNLVDRAVRAWRSKHPNSKVDDCTAVCLFLKLPPSSSTKPKVDARTRIARSRALSSESFMTARTESYNTARGEEVAEEIMDGSEGWTALEGVSRANSMMRVPRFASLMSWRKRSVKVEEDED